MIGEGSCCSSRYTTGCRGKPSMHATSVISSKRCAESPNALSPPASRLSKLWSMSASYRTRWFSHHIRQSGITHCAETSCVPVAQQPHHQQRCVLCARRSPQPAFAHRSQAPQTLSCLCWRLSCSQQWPPLSGSPGPLPDPHFLHRRGSGLV